MLRRVPPGCEKGARSALAWADKLGLEQVEEGELDEGEVDEGEVDKGES